MSNAGAMPVALQRETLDSMLERNGVTDFDVSGTIDPTLHLDENINAVEDRLDTTLRNNRINLDAYEGRQDKGNRTQAASIVLDRVDEHGWADVVRMVEDGDDAALQDMKRELSRDFIYSVIHTRHGVERRQLLVEVIQLEQTVHNLLSEKPEYENVLSSLIEYERDEQGGWTHRDVQVNPGKLSLLTSRGLVEQSGEKGGKRAYTLIDRDAVAAAIDTYTEEQEQEPSPELDAEEIDTETLDDVDVPDDLADEFRELAEEKDMVNYWADHVAPAIRNRGEVKKALLLQLASMWDKPEVDDKNRINVLLYGKSGTGKSGFKSFLVREFGAIDINGDRASKADLTYNKTTDEYGHLAHAHHDILVVEEADEMDNDAFGSILTSIGETGYVKIRDKKIKAETKALLLANDISDWKPEVLNRFTFRIEVDELDDIALDDGLSYRYKHWNKEKPGGDTDRLRQYLKWVGDYEPEIRDLDAINEFKQENIKHFDDFRMGMEVMRITLAVSRLQREPVTIESYTRAFKLYMELNNGEWNGAAGDISL